MQSQTDGMVALAERIASMYGYTSVRVLRRDKGYRNHSFAVETTAKSLLNVIIYKQEPNIVTTVRRADSVSDFVAERGIPARHSLDSRIVRIDDRGSVRYARIYDYLPGTTIPWETYTRGHLVALGITQAKLHALLDTYPVVGLPNIEDTCGALVTAMTAYFGEPGVQAAMQTKLGVHVDINRIGLYGALFEQCRTLTGRQVLHMDFVRGNILFDGTKIDGLPYVSGVLDFEKTAVGHRLFDIARTLAFLLVDSKYKTSDQTSKYFLRSGYVKRGGGTLTSIPVKLKSGQHDLLALLLDFYLLHDFYKFLRHNPYESLHANEHYVRTRDILHHRAVL